MATMDLGKYGVGNNSVRVLKQYCEDNGIAVFSGSKPRAKKQDYVHAITEFLKENQFWQQHKSSDKWLKEPGRGNLVRTHGYHQ